MEELKLLVQMVASLPTLAVWVIVAFYVYKVSIIGSVYGVIRYGMSRLHDWAITRKTLPPIEQEIRFNDRLHGIVITSDETMALLMLQLQRIRGKNTNGLNSYIHTCSVDWLRAAINEKEQKDNAEEFKRNLDKELKKENK